MCLWERIFVVAQWGRSEKHENLLRMTRPEVEKNIQIEVLASVP